MMEWDSLARKIILTNIPDYYVTDENCENLYYKALYNNICRVLIGPSSAAVGVKFQGRGIKTGIGIDYPAGTSFPDLKAKQIADCEKGSNVADMYFVTAAVGIFLSGHIDNLRDEMIQCVYTTGKPVYFTIEAAEIPDEYLAKLCEIAKEAKVTGVVTSTAFMPYDIKRVTMEDIKRTKKYTGKELELIAAGPFTTVEEIESAVKAGADAVLINESSKIIHV